MNFSSENFSATSERATALHSFARPRFLQKKIRVRATLAALVGVVSLAVFCSIAAPAFAQQTQSSVKPNATVPPTTQKPVDAAAIPPQAPPGTPTSESGSQYIIGPGDGIQVFVWRNPELSVTVPVRPDGKVSTPLVEDMVAVGKTPSQLARDIETRLAEYIRSPQVSIIVSNALSAYSQIRVIGQVAHPQSLPFREGMTLLDVALVVGGLTDFAAGNKTKLIRKDPKGGEKTTRVRLDDLLRKGKIAENVVLQPGDVIIVPESLF